MARIQFPILLWKRRAYLINIDEFYHGWWKFIVAFKVTTCGYGFDCIGTFTFSYGWVLASQKGYVE